MAKPTHHLYIGGVTLTGANSRFRFTESSTAYSAEMPGVWATSTAYIVGDRVIVAGGDCYECISAHTSGTFAIDYAAAKWQISPPFFLRGDGARDDYATVMADAMTATGASGVYSAGVVFDFNYGSVASQLTISTSAGTWAPAHDDVLDEVTAALTGFPAATPSEAVSHTSTTSPEHAWVPTRPGHERYWEEMDAETNYLRDGYTVTWKASEERPFRECLFKNIHASRAVERDNADPGACFDRWFRRFRTYEWELWRVEIDVNGQFQFISSLEREFLGVFKATPEQIKGGIEPRRSSERLPWFEIRI